MGVIYEKNEIIEMCMCIQLKRDKIGKMDM